MQGDAVVSSTSESLDADGSLAGRLEEAAGRELREACRQLPLVRGARCPAGVLPLRPCVVRAVHAVHAGNSRTCISTAGLWWWYAQHACFEACGLRGMVQKAEWCGVC